MSQATNWGVPLSSPATPDEYATRDSEALNALLTMHAGSARPAYLDAGNSGFWVDTSAAPYRKLTYWDGADDTVVLAVNTTTNAIALTNDAAWRTALGLGSMATQGAGAVAITGGTIAGAVTGATQSPGDNTTKLSTTQFVTAAIAAAVASVAPVAAFARATTTGTSSVTISSLSSAGKKFILNLNGCALAAVTSDSVWLRVGDSGGVKTSGYIGIESYVQNTNQSGVGTFASGLSYANSGTSAVYGDITIELVDAATYKYKYSGILHPANAAFGVFVSGSFTLTGPLDRVQILASLGGTTFSAMDFSVRTEF